MRKRYTNNCEARKNGSSASVWRYWTIRRDINVNYCEVCFSNHVSACKPLCFAKYTLKWLLTLDGVVLTIKKTSVYSKKLHLFDCRCLNDGSDHLGIDSINTCWDKFLLYLLSFCPLRKPFVNVFFFKLKLSSILPFMFVDAFLIHPDPGLLRRSKENGRSGLLGQGQVMSSSPWPGGILLWCLGCNQPWHR